MPRNDTDRPKVVPDGGSEFRLYRSVRGNSQRYYFYHRIFYENRHGSSVYTFRREPRCAGSLEQYLRCERDLLNATVKLRDGEALTQMKLGLKEKIAIKRP